MSRKHRSFSKEFKREAIALITEYGYTYVEAGLSLDIEAKHISRWRRELEAAEGEAFPGKGKPPQTRQRIRDLEHQVKRLQTDGKGYFSKSRSLLCQGKHMRYQCIDVQK